MRLLIVCDVRFYREGILAVLATGGDVVEGCAHADLTALPARPAADVVLVELREGFVQSLELLRERRPSACIVGLLLNDDAQKVVAAASCGVRAFVSREQSLAELVAAVRSAAAGEAVCPPSLAALLFERLGRRELPSAADVVLTPREREISTLMMRGMTNKEIASTLVIGPATVKNHVHSILRKLGVRGRGEAAALLRR